MNHIYRIVWNASLSLWTVASETAKGRSKSSSSGKKRLAAVLCLASPLALANPTGGTVSAGSGTIAQSGTTTTITQSCQNLAIDWSSFSVGAKETVQFFQPNAVAIALNRITGSTPTSMLGRLSANGQVFILNPNGVLFGRNAQVNVGGLLASTLNISNADLMAGKISLAGNSSASVINQGNLTSSTGGYVALVGARVSNQGSIHSPQGSALLAAGSQVTVNLNNGSLVGYKVDQGTLNALAENRQLIQADGGQVILTAQAANAIGSAVVNNTGIIEARTVQNKNGTILLLGDMSRGRVNAGGTLDASAPTGGNGGFIETSAAKVNIAVGTRVTTLAGNSTDSSTSGGTTHGTSGTWLIDPTDFTVAASGGDITGEQLSYSLTNGNVLIQTYSGSTGYSGRLYVNDVVNWAANTLTLSAFNDVFINSNLNGSASAKLALEIGQGHTAANATGNQYALGNGAVVNLPAGNSFSIKVGSDGSTVTYTVITSLGASNSSSGTDLQGMRGNLTRNYALGANIDASTTSGWNSGAGFNPIGTGSASSYQGTFAGLGHSISGLAINRPTTSYVGLFGYASGGTLRDFSLLGGSISGQYWVGAIAGYSGDTVHNVSSNLPVGGHGQYVGGLIGTSSNALIYAVSANGNVTNTGANTGGLVGYITGSTSVLFNASATGSVSGTYAVGGAFGNVDGGIFNGVSASGAVSGIDDVGGLTGTIATSTAFDSSASGNVTASGVRVGGLFGSSLTSNIQQVSATGTVATTGSVAGNKRYVGGLIGWLSGGAIEYATAGGAVSATGDYVGGLIGENIGATITYGQAYGTVSGGNRVGGLVGDNYNGQITYSMAKGAVTGSGTMSGGLVGFNSNGSLIAFSVATGAVTGASYVGGFVGNNNGTINNSYAIGNVSANGDFVGGFAGYNDTGGIIKAVYADNTITATGTGQHYLGGVAGYNNYGTVKRAYWNLTKTGAISGVAGGLWSKHSVIGLNAEQMKHAANFVGFNFNKGRAPAWEIEEGVSPPKLRGFTNP
jgi:filamentous hemagglutinin family protein